MHERLSVNGMCFPGATPADLGGHWRALGARRVSFTAPQLVGEGGRQAAEVVKAGDYKVETISHMPLVLGPLTPDESTWHKGRESLSRMIETGAAIGARSIYMLTGGHGTLTWEEAAEAFCKAVAPCVAQAKQAGVALAIENASTLFADLHIAHTLRDTTTLAEMAGIGVNMDVYGCWTEPRLKELIEHAMPHCKLVQLSDYVLGDRSLPCRAVPGDGAVPLKQILDWVLSAGYTGGFDFELIGPRIEKEGPLDALRRAGDYVGEILHQLGA